jgi:hypothetical protein
MNSNDALIDSKVTEQRVTRQFIKHDIFNATGAIIRVH